MTHSLVITLVITYTLLGAFVFTVIITCLSLIGIVKLADASQQQKLFKILIVEIVTICIGLFMNFINPDLSIFSDLTRRLATPVTIDTATAHDNKETIEKRVSVLVMSVFNDGGNTEEGHIDPPEGYELDNTTKGAIKSTTKINLGKTEPKVTITTEGDRVHYRVFTKHGPWYDQWRSSVTVEFTVRYRRK